MVVSSPLTVAVVGGGPGGMFFCHALETQRRALKEQGDDPNSLANLPIVTCFERAAAPGGVWRSERTVAPASTGMEEEKKEPDVAVPTTNMYEALWTNGPKENIEFFDYTFEEHFGEHPLPVYMPRQPILEYMNGRVTKNCPDFFENYMKFNTSVESVCYVESTSKFEIVTRNMWTGEETKGEYDKCIWAGGENGRPMMPASLIDMFQTGGFTGRIIHSTETANFENDTKGKRVLLIGGSYSAEDLALMAIKVGAEQVYVSSRDDDNAINWAGAWPDDKVQVLEKQIPVGVTENGRCIQFATTEWAFPDKYIPEEKVDTEIRDIDTIIFCTGYLPNLNMLDKELRQPLTKDTSLKLTIPKEWRMEPNKLTELVGDVEPGDVMWYNSPVTFPGLYRCLSINNPSMMFITTDVENPMTGVDVCSWLLLRYITGAREVPSAEEMVRQNEQDALIPMDNPYWRFCMDSNYNRAFTDNLEKSPERPKTKFKLLGEFSTEHDYIYSRFLARSAQEAQYPVDFGSFEELNETSSTIIKYDELSLEHRTKLTVEDAASRRTFRDCNDSDAFRSLYTGAKSVSLKQLWLDMDANDPSILEP